MHTAKTKTIRLEDSNASSSALITPKTLFGGRVGSSDGNDRYHTTSPNGLRYYTHCQAGAQLYTTKPYHQGGEISSFESAGLCVRQMLYQTPDLVVEDLWGVLTASYQFRLSKLSTFITPEIAPRTLAWEKLISILPNLRKIYIKMGYLTKQIMWNLHKATQPTANSRNTLLSLLSRGSPCTLRVSPLPVSACGLSPFPPPPTQSPMRLHLKSY